MAVSNLHQGVIAGAAAAGGYTIDQSIRFNDGDSPKLTGGTGQTGDGTQWTISMWVKRGAIDGGNKTIWSAGEGSNKRAFSRFVSGGAGAASEDINFAVRTGGSWYELNVDQSFVDPSAWYHFVWVWDSDNGTAADRMRIYVNGDRLTSFSNTPSYPASATATDSWNNSTYAHQIGFEDNTRFFDGYLAEMYHIDGQALTPASFGETNSDTGQWIPKDASGLTFGTRGWYLKGEDSSDLGNDSSGNGNDFTSSGLAAADQVTDSPTDNFATWNSESGTSTNAATFSDGNLTAIRSSGGTNIVGSTVSFPATGNWYAEFTIDATGSGSFIWQVGIIEVDDAERFDTSEPRLGQAAKGYAYTTNWSGSPVPSKQNNNSAVSYGTGGSATDVIGVHLNNGTLVFYHNNSSQGTAYSGITGEYIFAWSGQAGAKVTANFGQSGFTYTPPTGAVALSTANLDDPTIADPGDYFETVLYTGNGTTGQSITGIGFQPDWVWTKIRSPNAYSHQLFDAVRGAGKNIQSNASNAEGDLTAEFLSFDSDGFTIDDDGNSNVNESGSSYVSWNWKANGSGSSNGNGSITSTVSANATSGFSIVTYTGTGANATVGHGLGAVPKMIIIKDRSNAESWIVYHEAVGNDGNLYLNLTNGKATQAMFNNTTPTSSVFSLGSLDGANKSSANHVAYCFAEVEGFSKFGEFKGNGNADGPFIYTGFKPRWVMIKRYNTTESWPILDTARGSGNFGADAGTSGNDPTAGNDLNAVLVASTSAAEEDNPTGSRRASFLSNGFKVRTTNTAMNASGSDYIYMAFAESPFKHATAR